MLVYVESIIWLNLASTAKMIENKHFSFYLLRGLWSILMMQVAVQSVVCGVFQLFHRRDCVQVPGMSGLVEKSVTHVKLAHIYANFKVGTAHLLRHRAGK